MKYQGAVPPVKRRKDGDMEMAGGDRALVFWSEVRTG